MLGIKTAPKADKKIVEDMLAAGTHFGFAKSRRHPSVSQFILGRKESVDVFDLEKVALKLQEALDLVAKIASEGKQILFVGGKRESQKAIAEAAERVDMPYVAGRFIGGTLTNFGEIRKRVDRLTNLITQRDRGELGKYTKRERLMIDREIEDLEATFGGIVSMTSKPSALFIIDADKDRIARDEAIKCHIPVISLCSSDCDISKIDYPIPANDSAIKSITYFTNRIADVYQENAKKK